MAKRFMLLLLIVFQLTTVNGQVIKSKLDAVAGISARDYIHAGFRYQYTEITQFGFYLGNDLELQPTENIQTYCFDHMFHFGGLNFYSNRPVWYVRQGYTLSVNNIGLQETRKFSYLNISAGRDFALNDWFGINADLGFIWQFGEYFEQNGVSIGTPVYNSRRFFSLVRVQMYLSF